MGLILDWSKKTKITTAGITTTSPGAVIGSFWASSNEPTNLTINGEQILRFSGAFAFYGVEANSTIKISVNYGNSNYGLYFIPYK